MFAGDVASCAKAIVECTRGCCDVFRALAAAKEGEDAADALTPVGTRARPFAKGSPFAPVAWCEVPRVKGLKDGGAAVIRTGGEGRGDTGGPEEPA